jgi:heptosyltransferase-2
MPHEPGKILIIRLSSLGDLVLMLPTLRALRSGLPGAEIHLLCKEKYAGLFEGNSLLDRLITVGRGGPRELLALRSSLARQRYDTIIDAHGVIRSNILYHTLRARRKLQIRKNELKKFLLIRGGTNRYTQFVSQTERYAALARELGVAVVDEPEELALPAGAAEDAQRSLEGAGWTGRPLVAFAPGARWPTKTWPEEHYAALIGAIAGRGYQPLLVGGADDVDTNARVARLSGVAPLDLTGALSIIGSAAVLRRCKALVTNDSAPLHLAEAVGTPVVAFFGPTVREFGYFPRLPGSRVLEAVLSCRPCSRNGGRDCPYGTKECLSAIEPAAALEALVPLLEEREALP